MTSVMADTPEAIAFFQLASIRGRLALELDTGLKFRISTLAAVNRIYGQNFKRKKQALDFVEYVMACLMEVRQQA